ncbi:hypothetical protein IAU60_003488 [Kwoniella sp. DSM 27419]
MSAVSTRSPQHVSFSTRAETDDREPPVASSSSTMRSEDDALVPSSSSPSRSGMMPLGELKTIPPSRRGVIFSPRNDTKYFHSDDLILPSPSAQALTPKAASSVRSYSDPVTPQDSPSKGKSRFAAVTPTLVRSILKSRLAEQIRLAASVEEGTLNNKEAARLLVSGKRPRLMARDSFQLAMLRSAAGDGTDRKGKGRMQDEIPGSDDSTASSSSVPGEQDMANGEEVSADHSSDEEEEEVEQDGALATGSLISIILDEPQDLLTLEEAYNTLTLRLRQRIPVGTEDPEPQPPAVQDEIRMITQPLRDEAPAMVRAIQRDLRRLLGKRPQEDSNVLSSEGDSPFRDLMPLRDSTPTNARARFTPSPTPGPLKSSSPIKSARQGYTESEVRYRREASGVGAAVLRFLSFTFHTPHLYSCYSEADLQSLLEHVMTIPRTPKLPTPNPKRTYYLSVLVLAQMNLPSACVQPVKDKIVRALEGAMADNLGAMGGAVSGKEGPSATKKEGFTAVTNVVSNYPSIFFPYYADLLVGCLRGMASSNNIIRYKAGAAVSAFARAKFALLASTQAALIALPTDHAAREAWSKSKAVIQKSEFFVQSHLKSALRVPGKATPVYGKDGDKKTEWHALEQVFKDTVGSTTDVHWACAAWSVVVTLMGSAYASSGLAAGFDHIIDRSLQPSTNTVRPLLARVAWNHAIHAYLSSGMITSVSTDGWLVRSYKPFAASSQQTAEQRTAAIQLAVDLGLSRATDKASYAKATTTARPGVDAHYYWQRSEKAKKFQWLVICGLGATALIYAHTGMALFHEDQPAKEMTTISGLPSSDGAQVPELSPEETKLPRIDDAWEKVIHPTLQSFFAIRGVDRLTTHGWAILEALTSTKTESQAVWSLDRLLVPRYMNGQIFAREKDTEIAELMADIQDDELQASDIPSCGSFWVAKRLGRLLTLFEEALTSVYGLNDTSTVEWIKSPAGTPLIPVQLSRVWENLLQALKSIRVPRAPPTPLYSAGLQAIAHKLLDIFARDPKTYISICKVDANGTCTLDIDELRLAVTGHLFDQAIDILGGFAVGSSRVHIEVLNTSEGGINPATAFGADTAGCPTIVGMLLGAVLRSRSPTLPLQSAVLEAFQSLVKKALDVGTSPGVAGKLLGDITNSMPFLFEDCEQLQLEVWRLIATRWTAIIDLQPSSSTSSTNHTGALLVSLLSGPFRGRQVTSYWHQQANEADLQTWQDLLEVTVLRFRAKRVGANLGVLEALAGHLSDFLGEAENTYSTTITLSCLAAAVGWMSFAPSHPNQSQLSPWQIDDKHLPVDFLALINHALIEAYSSPDTQKSTQSDASAIVSPAVEDLLGKLCNALAVMPAEYVSPALTCLKSGLSKWMEDPAEIASTGVSDQLDQLYVTVVKALTQAFASGQLEANSGTVNSLAELYAPRLSKARSEDVPIAFRNFWNEAFGQAYNLVYSNDVADFLRDILAAVPGMITAPGLEGQSSLSGEESLARYPHIAAATPYSFGLNKSDRIAEAVEDIQMTPIAEPPLTAVEYDADVSQSAEKTLPEAAQAAVVTQSEPVILVDETKDEIVPPSSPTSSVAGNDSVDGSAPADLQPSVEEDVFGPASLTTDPQGKKKVSAKNRKRTAKKGKGKRALPAQAPEEAAADQSTRPEIKRARTASPIEVDAVAEQVLVTEPTRLQEKKALSETPITHREMVQGTPTPASPATATPSQGITEVVVDASPSAQDEHTRSSLLTSAGRWLSRVPSFPFFSPVSTSTPHVQSGAPRPVQEAEDVTVDELVEEVTVSPVQPSVRARKSRKERKDDLPLVEAVVQGPETAQPTELKSTRSASALAKRAAVESPPSSTGKGKRKAAVAVPEVSEPRRSKRTRSKSELVIEAPEAVAEVTSESQSVTEAPLVEETKQGITDDTIIHVEDDEEDELLLSPESARRRRWEEEAEVRASQTRLSVGLGVPLPRVGSQSQSQSQSISGVFDDAPEDTLPRPSLARTISSPTTKARLHRTRSNASGLAGSQPSEVDARPPTQLPLPTTSPAKRSTQQTRILAMLDEAARAKDAIDNLDYQGVKALLRNLNTLREAAEERMMTRLEEYRNHAR